MSEDKQYAERDLMAMDIAGNHYCRHVSSMTREQLHSKSDIAAELGWRDMQIAELKAQRDALAAENAALKSAIVIAKDDLQEHYDTEGVDSQDSEGNFMDACVRLCDAQCTIEKLENITIPATDAYLNSVRADVLLQLFNEQMEWALVNWQWSNFTAMERAAIREGDCELSGVILMLKKIADFENELRAGEAK